MKLLKISLHGIFCLLCLSVYSQSEVSLYDYFDQSVGVKNLGINNGPVYLNTLRSADLTHRYYVADKYFIGSVVYDGQPYAHENLKYDVVKDQLIAKINGQNNSLGISLIQAKTPYFSIDGRKFVNLSFDQKTPGFVSGYYEEYLPGDKLALYIKYRKQQIDVLRTDGIYYSYPEKNEFVTAYGGTFHKLNDARDWIRLFPDFEKNIADYAYLNRETERSDKIQFMKMMAKHISGLLSQADKKL